MKILVTGSGGMFGSRIVPALIADGNDVSHLDLRQGLDVRDRDDAHIACVGIDTVIHLAAIPWGQPKYSASDYWSINVTGTAVMVDAAINRGVKRFILASSTGYYGFQRGWPFGNNRAWLDDMNATQRYGIQMNPELMPDWNAAQRSRLHYMTSKIGAEAALSARAIGEEIHGVVLRFAPVTPEPYEWGIWCTKERAVATILSVLHADAQRPFEVYNVGEECEILPECYNLG